METTDSSKEYSHQKLKIDDLSESIQLKASEINQLEQSVLSKRQRVEEIIKRLSTADKDMAKGTLSTDEYLALKKEFYDKESTLKALIDAVTVQKSARDLLINDRSLAQSILSQLRILVSNEISEQKINEIAEKAPGEILSLAHALLAAKHTADNGHDIYKDIGVLLCSKVFGGDKFKANLPIIYEAKNKIDQLITESA
jgi:predicted  nucleic acid-binding Zn-ribbon protein